MLYNLKLVVGAIQELIRDKTTPEPDEDIKQELNLLQTSHKHIKVRQFT
jgi:hypothetical protein